MKYEKSKSERLSGELFRNPTSEYRGAPFWAWNCKLDGDELVRQIGCFEEMGFGGFHMHVRLGMATPYLSDEYMGLIRRCTDTAKEKGMLAYLYDEDTWPSGFAGGFVTKDKRNRQRFITLSASRWEDTDTYKGSHRSGKPTLLAVYDLLFDADGFLLFYRRIDEQTEAEGIKRYVYLCTSPDTDRFNRQAYVDTMTKSAIDCFIEKTHERFFEAVGDEFGKTVPSIFTDEPQMMREQQVGVPTVNKDIIKPWCYDFADGFKREYGYDILNRLPEIFYDRKDGYSEARYHYHAYKTERFVNSYWKNIGKWCDEHGILLTGHNMAEDSLLDQTCSVGDAMRAYRYAGMPGIDTLFDGHQFQTAKQASSIAHQTGKGGVLCELYGITSWDYDFRDHKHHGDWQTALGVTLRVPHLSLVSLGGEAKRDYPASISFQSPWYKRYGVIEDHFARLATVLTRGKPVVRVAMLHPIESFWMLYGAQATSGARFMDYDEKFLSLTRWMLTGGVDFDYVNEGDMALGDVSATDKLRVGEMTYDTLLIPSCITLRESTLTLLSQFLEHGGRVIVVGEAPTHVDARPDARPAALLGGCERVPFDKLSVLSVLEEEKLFSLTLCSGAHHDGYVYQYRRDSDCDWLFLAHADKRGVKDCPSRNTDNLTLTLHGHYRVELYDTLTGEVRSYPYCHKGDDTILSLSVGMSDSLLFALYPSQEKMELQSMRAVVKRTERILTPVAYEREEENVLLLDMAEYSVDGGAFAPMESVIQMTSKVKKDLQFPSARCQPWLIKPKKCEHTVTVRYRFRCDVAVEDAVLAIEDAQVVRIRLDGRAMRKSLLDGYYIDPAIAKLKMPRLARGEHVLEIAYPFGERTFIEPCYVLSSCDVNLSGAYASFTPASDRISFGDVTTQGMPFYGGNLNYTFPLTVREDGLIRIRVSSYRGALLEVYVDGEYRKDIVFAPYEAEIPMTAGEHTVCVRVYGNRYNTLGPVHHADETELAVRPSSWHGKGDCFSYEYSLHKSGVLSAPVIEEIAYVEDNRDEDAKADYFDL